MFLCECGLCLCMFFFFGKIDYDIKKQQFLGEENIFSSTLVQYIIIIFFCLFAFLWSTFIAIQKFTNTTLICCCFFCHHRHRSKKEEYRDLLFVRFFFSLFIWKLLLFCVWIYSSLWCLALCYNENWLHEILVCFAVYVSHLNIYSYQYN